MSDLGLDPVALSSRPSISLSTASFHNTTSFNGPSPAHQPPSIAKPTKAPSINFPSRIDLEPRYTALKATIGHANWPIYTEALTSFLTGRLSQTELSETLDSLLASPDGHKERLHNQLIVTIYANITKALPDPGVAPWVSAHEKPVTASAAKLASADAAERRIKKEVMALPARDRRRIKELATNEPDPFEAMADMFLDHHKSRPIVKTTETPASATAGGLNGMNWDLEIRKRFAQPLAIESGELPDAASIEGRMLPMCYEAGLVSGHKPDASQFISAATETFIKEALTTVFTRTRCNGHADHGNRGYGPAGGQWILTGKYKRRLAREEDAFLHGKITRDKSNLLPVEAKAASERGPLTLSDLMLAVQISDFGLSHFPILEKSLLFQYREGELENWDDYTWLDGRQRSDDFVQPAAAQPPSHQTSSQQHNKGTVADSMDVDSDYVWEGATPADMEQLDVLLDACLAT